MRAAKAKAQPSTAKADVERPAAPDETAPLVPGKELSLYKRLFLVHLDAAFGRDAELAARAAFFVIIVGSPFMLPNALQSSWFKKLVESGAFSKSTITYFIFTLYKTFGNTLHYAWCALWGTILAAVCIWSLNLIYPGGWTGHDSPVTMIGTVLYGGVFVVNMLWLNTDINTTIFSISTFVWYWMKFMDPKPDGFLIHWDHRADELSDLPSETQRVGAALASGEGWGPAMRDLFACTWGCLIALLVVLVPHPFWSMQEATQTGARIVTSLQDGWLEFAEYFCAPRASDFTKDEIKHKLRELKANLEVFDGHIASAWWECWRPATITSRQLLVELSAMMHVSCDRLFGAWNLCMWEEFGEMHARLVARIGAPVRTAVTEASALMTKCMQAAADGGVSSAEVDDLRMEAARVRDAASAMELEFRAAKHALRLPGITEELLDEHVFCLSVCSLCRVAVEYAEGLVEISTGGRRRRGLRAKVEAAIVEFFDPERLFDPLHLNFVLRNSCNIFIGMAIGFFGVHTLLEGKDANIASTAAVLLSSFCGSAMAKNLGRVQGVVIGTGVGQIVRAFTGICYPIARIAQICVIFAWSWVSLFTYYNAGSQWSYFGSLLAVFGVQQMVSSCTIRIDPIESFHSNCSTIGAVAIMTGVDVVLGAQRPSLMAHKTYLFAWQRVEHVLRGLFDPKEAMTQCHKGAVMALISKAELFGVEAAQEPRYWRTPWRAKTFQKAIHTLQHLRFMLASMEYSLSKGFVQGGPKNEVFMQALQMPAFRKIAEVIQQQMVEFEPLLRIFVHDVGGLGPLEEFQDKGDRAASARTDYVGQSRNAIGRFIVELGESKKAFGGQRDDVKLEECPLCILSLIIRSLNLMTHELAHLRSQILEFA